MATQMQLRGVLKGCVHFFSIAPRRDGRAVAVALARRRARDGVNPRDGIGSASVADERSDERERARAAIDARDGRE